ncbi:16S ribosomal RNA methyltransferase KsgA/Dim1 family protein [Citrobacter koseri]|nr:16S ribosomal RNA methyltransferase KsgA/Dim1 family protein [Citrobacter koseri]
MHSQLRERIRLMRARLDNAAPVAEIRAESQLFVTPAPVCDRLVTLAEISNRDHILEPSAGTGAILRAIRDTAPEAMCDAVEINSGLVRYLRENFNGVRVQCGDFMEWQPVQYYSRIIMNPPFSHGRISGISCGLFPCCVRGACWLPSVSTGRASRRSCYRFLTSARSCRAARLLIPMSRR